MAETKMNEVELSELLRQATADQPPSRMVDLPRAREDGGRKLRRRRATTSVGSGLAVVAVLATAVVVVSTTGNAPLRVGASADPSATAGSTSAPAPVAPTRFDPLRLRFAAGWLPEGMSNMMKLSHVSSQMLSVEKPGPSPQHGSDDRSVNIVGYAAGVAPSRMGLFNVSGAEIDDPITAMLPPGGEGPTINGFASVWYAAGRTLAWQWAPGAWATVSVYLPGPIDGPLLDVAAHIASTVRTDVDQPMALPFSVAAPPAPLRLVESVVGPDFGDLVFSDVDDMRDPATGDSREFRIEVTRNDALTVEKLGPPTATFDGHPAVVTFGTREGEVLLMGVNGCWVNASVHHPVTMTYVDKDALTALARGVQVVPNIADQKSWTTSPVR